MSCFDRLALTALTAAMTLTCQPALARQYQVKMLNKGAMGPMVFEPALLKIAPGDTVTFVPTDKGHNAQSIPELSPVGGSSFRGTIGEPITVTFKTSGLYIYKCLPHYFMGMVGIIQVGAASNKAAVERGLTKTPPFAKIRLSKLFARVK